MQNYLKSLSDLQRIGDEILEKVNKDNPFYEVDIDYIVEAHYDIRIEAAPLKWEFGIEGYPCLGGHKIFIDSTLMNDIRQEKRYRFTLAEELAHIILHRDVWKDINTVEQWIDAWTKIPDNIYNKLDNNAKELAGIILLPRYQFINRAIEIRNESCRTLGYSPDKLSDEQKDEIRAAVIRVLMDDFNVNAKPCEIRLERTERYFKQTLVDMELKPHYLKKRKQH